MLQQVEFHCILTWTHICAGIVNVYRYYHCYSTWIDVQDLAWEDVAAVAATTTTSNGNRGKQVQENEANNKKIVKSQRPLLRAFFFSLFFFSFLLVAFWPSLLLLLLRLLLLLPFTCTQVKIRRRFVYTFRFLGIFSRSHSNVRILCCLPVNGIDVRLAVCTTPVPTLIDSVRLDSLCIIHGRIISIVIKVDR